MKAQDFPSQVIDHSVSKEPFELHYNAELEMLETRPQPTEEDLPNYYKSDDYISHTDTKHSLFERVYRWVRTYTLKQKTKLIAPFKKEDGRLLDIGCGTGDFLHAAAKVGWQCTGVEPNEQARLIANEKTNNAVVDNDAMLQFTSHSFDVITLWHVLEHVPNLTDYIVRLKHLLKPHGRIVIAVPNFKSFDASYYKTYWAAYDVPRHLWHFSQSAIKQLFGKHDMQVEQKVPMKFDAYYVSLLSEKYKSGWMNFFSAFFIASRSNLKANKSGEYSSIIYVIKNN